MPEGPEIKRLADRLHAVLAGEPLSLVRFLLPDLVSWETRLADCGVHSVEARGKALLIHFDNELTLYSHNQLYGRWEVVEGDRLPPSHRRLRVLLATSHHLAALYSATEVAVLDRAGLSRQPYLSCLGPDLLDPGVDAARVLRRLQRHPRRALMGLLQDQSVLAGIGNYLCCEILHVAGVHPRRRMAGLEGDEQMALARSCLSLARRAYLTAGITNDLYRAESLRARGLDFEARRFHVYRRQGLPCYRCGNPIEKMRLGAQPVYLCPRCQPLEGPSSTT